MILSWLAALVLVSSQIYIVIMFGGIVSSESVVEALNCSVQTVTTVGYGNWEPAGIADRAQKVFWVKVLSLPLMVFGAALFAAAIAVAIDLSKR
jgi:hypothetical protein